MNDQDIMESLLLTTKGACDLHMHGTIESSTPNVHQAFDAALSDTLSMQSDIYRQMAQKGWYPPEQAQAQQMNKVHQKYAKMN